MLYLHCDFTGNRKYLNVRLKGNIGFLVYCDTFIKKYYITIGFFNTSLLANMLGLRLKISHTHTHTHTHTVFYFFAIISPLEMGMAFYLNKIKIPLIKNALCQG